MAAVCSASVEFFKEVLTGKVNSSENNVTLNVGNGKKISGVSCIAKHLQRTLSEFKDVSLEERMEVEQWLEYRLFIENLKDVESTFLNLQELNNYLEDKVYCVGNQLTLADILLYHSLHAVFSNLSFHDKEKFMNVSRWFNNIQQDRRSRQSLAPLTFVRCPLYSGASSH